MLAGLWPSVAETARILDDTGREIIPAGFDIEALRADLYRCRLSIIEKKIDTAGYRKSHKKAATNATKQARALIALLKSSGNGLFDRQLWSALDPGDHENAGVLLDRIAREAERIGHEGIDAVPAQSGAKDYVVEVLVPIYEQHFKRTAGTAADGSGPFSRFVYSVSERMGRSIRVSHHTVHKSLATKRRDVGKT